MIIKATLTLFPALLWTCVQMVAQIYCIDVPGFPLADTIYYPFQNGQQLIEIDHLTDYNMAQARYARMSQPPRIWWYSPIGNEYVFRDSTGQVTKTFNSLLHPDSLRHSLRPVPYVSQALHTTNLYNEQHRREVQGYYKVFNVPIQAIDVSYGNDGTSYLTGLIDSIGNIIVPIEYNEIRMVGDYFLLVKDNKWGLTDKNYNYLLPHFFDRFNVEGDLMYFYNQSQITYAADTKTGQLINLVNHHLQSFDNKHGILMLKQNDQWGMIDIRKNKILIPCIYERMVTYHFYSDFNWLERGYVWVTQEGKYGLVSLEGKVVLPCISERLFTQHDAEEGMVRVMVNGVEKEVEVRW